MKIQYKNIILRDMVEADIEDDIRWKTRETQWMLWDEPWSEEESKGTIDTEELLLQGYEEFEEIKKT